MILFGRDIPEVGEGAPRRTLQEGSNIEISFKNLGNLHDKLRSDWSPRAAVSDDVSPIAQII